MLISLVYLLGGFAIFLFGMKTMSDALQQRGGDQIRDLLKVITGHPFFAVLTGFATTSVIQSSSATTVMVVSLVHAQLLDLTAAIGVIMGANVGTTITAWLVALFGFKMDIATFALPAIALSLPFRFSKRQKLKEFSAILFGFGLLFIGISEMKEAVSGLNQTTETFQFVSNLANLGYTSILLFVLFGAVLTVMVQSSSAAMAMTITLAFNGWIPYHIACAIVLGENIGTTVTAFLASIEMSAEAKRAARAHMLFNLFGVLWMLILFNPFIILIDMIMPGDPTSNPAVLPMHLAAFHTLFNLTNTLALVGFIPLIEKIVTRLVNEDEVNTGAYRIPYIYRDIADRAEVNIINAKAEVAKMSRLVYEMFERMMNLSNETSSEIEESIEFLRKREELTDQMQEQISFFLSDCLKDNLTDRQAERVACQLRIVNELESIADAIYKISHLVYSKKRKKRAFHTGAWEEINAFTFRVMDFIKYHTDYLGNKLLDQDNQIAVQMENGINLERSKLDKVSRKEIDKGADLKGELLFMEIVRQLEHIGDFCTNIHRAIIRITSEPKSELKSEPNEAEPKK